MFRNGRPTTTRIHFFDIEVDRDKRSEWVQAVDIRRDYPRRAPVLAVLPFAAKLVPTFAQALTPMAPWVMVV